MGQFELIHFASDDALAASVADAWVSSVAKARTEGRRLLVALSGGRVAKKLFASAVTLANVKRVSLQAVEFFWADERCVPPDDPESNFRLANEFLFRPGRVAVASVHRIESERDPEIAAQLATNDLRRISDSRPTTMPVLDLIILGMGEDGHVASLFPNNPFTESDINAVFLAVEHSPKPPPNRVTLGYAPIAAAREVWVLASGQGKQAALRESLSPTGRTPLARIIQSRPLTRIFSDTETD